MLLHIDGSEHRWFQDERWHDLLVILDDANSEIYYAQLVEEEATATVLAGLKEVVEHKGVFCALYSDSGSHFWLTPKAGEAVDRHRLTQVGVPCASWECGSFPPLTAAAGTEQTQLWRLAGPVAAGTAAAWDRDGGGGECLSARALHRRIQSPLPSRQRATGQRLYALPSKGFGAHFCCNSSAR